MYFSGLPRRMRRDAAGEVVREHRDTRVVHDRFLHRQLDALAFAGALALDVGGEDPDREVDAGSGVAERHAEPLRGLALAAVHAHRSAGCLSDHVERPEARIRTGVTEAAHAAVDQSGMDLA